MTSNGLVSFLLTALTSTALICIILLIIGATIIGLRNMFKRAKKEERLVDAYNAAHEQRSSDNK